MLLHIHLLIHYPDDVMLTVHLVSWWSLVPSGMSFTLTTNFNLKLFTDQHITHSQSPAPTFNYNWNKSDLSIDRKQKNWKKQINIYSPVLSGFEIFHDSYNYGSTGIRLFNIPKNAIHVCTLKLCVNTFSPQIHIYICQFDFSSRYVCHY